MLPPLHKRIGASADRAQRSESDGASLPRRQQDQKGGGRSSVS